MKKGVRWKEFIEVVWESSDTMEGEMEMQMPVLVGEVKRERKRGREGGDGVREIRTLSVVLVLYC